MLQEIKLGVVDRGSGLNLCEVAEQCDLDEVVRPQILRSEIFYALAASPKALCFPRAFERFADLVGKAEGELAEMLLDVGMITKVMNGFVKAFEIVVVTIDSDPRILHG